MSKPDEGASAHPFATTPVKRTSAQSQSPQFTPAKVAKSTPAKKTSASQLAPKVAAGDDEEDAPVLEATKNMPAELPGFDSFMFAHRACDCVHAVARCRAVIFDANWI